MLALECKSSQGPLRRIYVNVTHLCSPYILDLCTSFQRHLPCPEGLVSTLAIPPQVYHKGMCIPGTFIQIHDSAQQLDSWNYKSVLERYWFS